MNLLKPDDAIGFALLLSEGRCKPDFIVKALDLAGYQIVPKAGASSVPAIKPEPVRRTWPTSCSACSKIRNDQAHADECDRADCPLS